MDYWYRDHGLIIRSEVELALRPGPQGSGTPDLVLHCGAERTIPSDDPPGSRLARLCSPDGTLRYSLGRGQERTVLRYPGLCDFVGDADLTDVTVHLHPGADPGLIPVLAGGALIAVHLKLRHELVLHASAVQLDDGALAFVGSSGMGKSTLAALLATGGRGLVTDDVMRVDMSDSVVVRVHPGGTESRLRQSARQLTDAAPSDAVRATADGRLALRPDTRADTLLALTACVVPLPTRQAVHLSVKRLPKGRGLVRMIQFPRLVGWCEPVSAAREFQALADLVERVPIFEASVPWGPPFRPEVLSGLLAAVSATGQNQR